MISNTDLEGAAALAPIRWSWGSPHRVRIRSRPSPPGAAAPSVNRAERQCPSYRGSATASRPVEGVTAASANPITGERFAGVRSQCDIAQQRRQRAGNARVRLGTTEAEIEAGAGWSDKVAIAARDWAINALVERLALAMISVLA